MFLICSDFPVDQSVAHTQPLKIRPEPGGQLQQTQRTPASTNEAFSSLGEGPGGRRRWRYILPGLGSLHPPPHRSEPIRACRREWRGAGEAALSPVIKGLDWGQAASEPQPTPGPGTERSCELNKWHRYQRSPAGGSPAGTVAAASPPEERDNAASSPLCCLMSYILAA